MASRLYWHAAAHGQSGSYPAGEQSSRTPSVTWTGATTIRAMNTTIGAGQTSVSTTSPASTAQQDHLIAMFTSPPLDGAQTVGGGNMILNCANAESNAAANFWVDSLNVYVWRPSSGAAVGTVRDAADLGGTEPLATNNEEVLHISGITSSGVAAQDGDVIILEVWARTIQGMGNAYTDTVYFDGTTANTTANATVSNHASFLELAETLAFKVTYTPVDPFGQMGFFGI